MSKAKVGKGAPIMGLTEYLRAYPKAIVQNVNGQRIQLQGENLLLDDKPSGTVGAPPIGTGLDGQLLEVPKIVPAVGNISVPNLIGSPAVPYTTQLQVNDSYTFVFNLRSNPYGPMMVKGFYALAFNESGELLDLRDGGHTIELAFKITGEQIWQGHIELGIDDWYVLALPTEAGAGANVEVTMTRFDFPTTLPETVYLAWGVYGIQRHFIPPSFHIDSTLDPVRNQSTGFRSSTYDANSTTQINVPFSNRHPTIVDEMWFGGDMSTFFELSWEAGELAPYPIPTALFRYARQGGQLPAPLLINAPMSLKFSLLNWRNEEIVQALNLASASYGY